MTIPIKSPRKLIEVALPLDSINKAAAREKSIRHGHPSTLHLWWARRPLAAARAVVFAQLVNDPGYQQGRGFKYGKNKKEAAIERQRLFKIIEELVIWENTNNTEILERAQAEILRSWRELCDLNKDHPDASKLFDPNTLPAFHDPFCGGGAIPLEAQRLGLESFASDLNPVAVLLNKALIEIPPLFANTKPVGPLPNDERLAVKNQPKILDDWTGAKGLSEDVRRYGHWIREQAFAKIGDLYPQPILPEKLGASASVAIAWIWARTVKSPNPAFSHVDVPLASTFILSTREGKESYLEPLIAGDQYSFRIVNGVPPVHAENGTKLARGANFVCLMSGSPIDPQYIKKEAMAKRMGSKLLAIVADSKSGRVYLPATERDEAVAFSQCPRWVPTGNLIEDARAFTPTLYGISEWSDLFTNRQLVALTTFSDLVIDTKQKILNDAIAAGMSDDKVGLDAGGTGAQAYADAVTTYLAFVVDKVADYWSSIATWHQSGEKMRNTFGRQAIAMTWDYAEANPFCTSSGNWMAMVDWTSKAIATVPAKGVGHAIQQDAQSQNLSQNKIVSTDPPYYDNIGYADLSDFFYAWLRKTLRPVYPGLLGTITTPKSEELVATAYRHGGKKYAEAFFLEGMTRAMHQLAIQAHPAFPVSIYYAFKQSDTKNGDTSSTGWETFLEAVIKSGFAISGTWPMRTELSNRMRGTGFNALASSVILVCCPRSAEAPSISRREFLRELNAILPDALDEMTKGSGGEQSPVAPVDLSQAIIGPGMAVFSKYAAILEADGEPMSVRTALQLINRFLAEDDFDRDTQFCLHWFEQHGWAEGTFGIADTLARAKGTSVDGVSCAGVINAQAGRVRLKKWSEYPDDWNPETDTRNPVWETVHQLIKALKMKGEAFAGQLLSKTKDQSESVRQLAYRLYTLCERQGWAEDARAYNELITSWTGIETAANAAPSQKQLSVFE